MPLPLIAAGGLAVGAGLFGASKIDPESRAMFPGALPGRALCALALSITDDPGDGGVVDTSTTDATRASASGGQTQRDVS